MVADRNRFTWRERLALSKMNLPWSRRHRLGREARVILDAIHHRRVVERKWAHPATVDPPMQPSHA